MWKGLGIDYWIYNVYNKSDTCFYVDIILVYSRAYWNLVDLTINIELFCEYAVGI